MEGLLMAGSIAVTPEQLKSQAKVYSQASSQIQDAIRKVNSMNQQISQQWKGQAFQAYLEQYNQLEGNVKQTLSQNVTVKMQDHLAFN